MWRNKSISQKIQFIPEGWTIIFNPKPIPTKAFDYDYAHDNYDGENELCGTGPSIESCLAQIEAIQNESESSCEIIAKYFEHLLD